MSDLVAFLDESKKPMRDPATGRPSDSGEHYVVAAAVVIKDDADIRNALVDAEERLGYRLHYSELRSKERRLAAVRELDRIRDWDGYLFETARALPRRHHSEHHIRAKALSSAFTVLGAEVGVSRIILETRATPQRGFTALDEKDHQVLQKLLTSKSVPADLRISHSDKSEQRLAIADIIAGARSDFLCLADMEIFPLIAHRVRGIKAVFKAPDAQRPRDYGP